MILFPDKRICLKERLLNHVDVKRSSNACLLVQPEKLLNHLIDLNGFLFVLEFKFPHLLTFE